MVQSFFPSQDIETLIDAMALPAFLLSADDDGTLRFRKLNPAHVETVGIPSEEIAGKTPHDFFPARVADTLLGNYQTCQLGNRPYRYEELLKLNDQEYWWETTLSPLHGRDGSVIGVFGVAVDITARKVEQFRAAEAYSDLQKLNESVALFTSMTAHDVRGPLAKINMLTEHILEGFEDMGDDKLQMIEITQKIAVKALSYVEDVLGHAKSLKTEPSRPVVSDMGHLCRDVAALVDPEAKFEFSMPDTFIESESIILQMIIRNLVDNASRHANTRIAIVAEPDPDNQDFLRFTVADDGTGFSGGSEEFEKRMEAQKIDDRNRGFGLAAVSHLIKTRGGKCWLANPYFEQGAAICFTLPGQFVPEGFQTAPT